ncbi:MAG: DNA polymerase III, delta' subunit [Microgenomates group bacterium Gr01-1014_7]|nr:MAG: DNA polymerase III, delta' subunit [Microgenomates group bacterium Gr01-1014_7]
MIARLLISPDLEVRLKEIRKILASHNLPTPHPDLLYFTHDSKLGIEQARKIKEHFSLKPYSAKGRVIVLEDASALTLEAQNALLKTLEEPPPDAILILAAPSDAIFLPTVLSRCQIIRIQSSVVSHQSSDYIKDIEKLINSETGERFEYIEKLKDRKEFLYALVIFFRKHLPANKDFVKELLQAEEWAAQNVNIRAILEYLMLVMPGQI